MAAPPRKTCMHSTCSAVVLYSICFAVHVTVAQVEATLTHVFSGVCSAAPPRRVCSACSYHMRISQVDNNPAFIQSVLSFQESKVCKAWCSFCLRAIDLGYRLVGSTSQDAWPVLPELLKSASEAIQIFAAKGLYTKVCFLYSLVLFSLNSVTLWWMVDS
jgi:hypothetical protein